MKGIDVLKLACLCGLVGFASFSLVFVLLNQRYGNCTVKNLMQSISGMECSSTNATNIDDVDTLKEIQQMIDVVRNKTRDDMRGYQYPNGVTKLEDLIIEENGRPIRSIILSTWRSGSSFTGAILGAQPGNFHFYEPLSHLNDDRFRAAPLASEALKQLKALMNCEFSGLDDYIRMAKMRPSLLNGTKYFREQCEALVEITGHNSTCYDQRYLSGICKVHPFQTIKLLRLRLDIAQEFLDDEKLGVRIVLLVRDPRGTIQSRKSRPWCNTSPDCYGPDLICADLVSEYKSALELMKKYPSTFRVIRYEDLSTDPFRQAEELFEFYGRNFHPKVINYLETHTSAQFDFAYGTYRDSKSTPFHWKTDLTFEEVDKIQRTCAKAMELWGYVPAINATHLIEFNPVADYAMN